MGDLQARITIMAKPKTQYAAMPGGCLSHEKAQIAGKELARIQKQHGCVAPATVVNESRPKVAPLHNEFTWDNSVAAEKWRENEARSIIRSVRIVTPEIPHAEQPVIRAFLNVQATDEESGFQGQAYLSYGKVVSNEDYKKQVLNTAMNELRTWQRRYSDYKDAFGGVFEAIEELETAEK